MERCLLPRAGCLSALILALVLASYADAQFYGQSIKGPTTQTSTSTSTPTSTSTSSQPAAATQAPASTQMAPAAPAQQSLAQSQATGAIVEASNRFAGELYQALRTEPGNLVVSPLSAAALLALAWLGSGGRTRQQLAQALHLPQDQQQVTRGYKALFDSLQLSDERLQLDAAHRVFLRRGLALRDDFRRAAEASFGAGAQEVDFARPADAAAAVNKWARQKTRGKVQQLVQPGALSAATALLLANAVYFKGAWRTQFDAERTALKPFRAGAGGGQGAAQRSVPLMWSTGDFPFARLPRMDAQAVRLPYAGGRVSMLVLLPNAPDGLPRLESAVATADLQELLRDLRTEEVQVWLPRFSVRSSLSLNDALVQLGLSDLFGSSANFSGIADQGAFLSRVLQKASIEVNEEGSEAAAATGGVFLLSAGLYNFFRADHPFLFYLLDDQTGTVLFQGRFTEPE